MTCRKEKEKAKNCNCTHLVYDSQVNFKIFVSNQRWPFTVRDNTAHEEFALMNLPSIST